MEENDRMRKQVSQLVYQLRMITYDKMVKCEYLLLCFLTFNNSLQPMTNHPLQLLFSFLNILCARSKFHV